MVSDQRRPARIAFIEMMGVPGSYDASVYDHFEDKDREGRWFVKRYGYLPNISISNCNVCIGEPLPEVGQIDGAVLAGSYNSVHDNTPWQLVMRAWLVRMRHEKLPMLGICGSHQLMAHMAGADVARLEGGPCAGTYPVSLTAAGRSSPLMKSLQDGDRFHFANSEHVTRVPKGSVLLASNSRVGVAALDFGDHCYSTQFHPEATAETLGTIWRHKSPALMRHYLAHDNGDQLVENFLRLVVRLSACNQVTVKVCD